MARHDTSRTDAIGVVYLARGADGDAIGKIAAFVRSYARFAPGLAHELHVVFKGFANASRLAEGRRAFEGVDHAPMFLEDEGFDIGAYFAAALRVDCRSLVFFNTASEICGEDWLAKLARNLALPGVGLVGCTGSFEAPAHPGTANIAFPNPHIRSNAFMIERARLLDLRPAAPLATKRDVHLFEHGPHGLTRRLAAAGLGALVVGRDGRGYAPPWWPKSETFRQGGQANLLVADNQTRRYQLAPVAEKQYLFDLCWGGGTLFEIADETFGLRTSDLASARR